MTYKFLPKTDTAKLKALTERLYERLADVKEGRATNISEDYYSREWEEGYDSALDDEIKFLTNLLDALEKS